MTAPVRYHMGSFPPRRLDWEALIPLLGPSAAAIARYDGALAALPNAEVLLSPLTTQEAVLSSRIEGTQATFGEVLEFEAEDCARDALGHQHQRVLCHVGVAARRVEPAALALDQALAGEAVELIPGNTARFEVDRANHAKLSNDPERVAVVLRRGGHRIEEISKRRVSCASPDISNRKRGGTLRG